MARRAAAEDEPDLAELWATYRRVEEQNLSRRLRSPARWPRCSPPWKHATATRWPF
jgi:hypothetical protein